MSSCVESGFDAQSDNSAPPAARARIKFAVSVVTCMQAEMRIPVNGFSFSKRVRICASTGMFRSAHSILFLPSAARAKSATSYLSVLFTAVAVTLILTRIGQ
ncbi:unannotated protein [freshwater metagenome]|uniref:Unannotated protein n=1 Tax=freshwater metagenome TaxID=449393 RepID=A0A6J7UGM3_9ZZZZ